MQNNEPVHGARERAEAWLAENREALESSNALVEKHGLPLGHMLDLHDPLTLQALLTVIEALQPLPVGAQLQFLLGQKGSLGGRTPLQALEDPTLRAKVRDVAQAFSESGEGLAKRGGQVPDIEGAPRRRPKRPQPDVLGSMPDVGRDEDFERWKD